MQGLSDGHTEETSGEVAELIDDGLPVAREAEPEVQLVHLPTDCFKPILQLHGHVGRTVESSFFLRQAELS